MLHRDGIIDSVDDVFYLYIEELSKLPNNARELIKTRKKYEENMKKIPAYSRLVFDENIFDKKIECENIDALNNSNEFRGTITSGGVAKGEVIVIDSPNNQIDTTDKIIVAKSTDPGWIFLIQNAKGIIAEKGSLLSHTAIISRELHKPAIVNVKDATRLIKTGDIVTLDAEKGIITIEKEK
jgi:pyruvate,water dikinase